MDTIDRFRGCLLGLAVGDAVGTTLEFKSRGSYEPISDMVGGGPFDLNPGEWTDDTSMALCLAASLVEQGGFDAKDQMERYCRWMEEGYMSSNGRCFDIGNTIADALRRFRDTGDPFSGSRDAKSAGNGPIMRLAPVPMFYYPDRSLAIEHAAESSRTTHGANECVDACRLFAGVLFRALDGCDTEEVLMADSGTFTGAERICAIARGEYRDKEVAMIQGTGYVVDSLEAALWCFMKTDTFEAAILQAANLGDDADTTAAVCGQVAGAYYGIAGIPGSWLKKLVSRELILELAEHLYHGNRLATQIDITY